MPRPDIEEHNRAQIELLNQRGGRTLSIVDLIDDGTITLAMAALCWMVIEQGASFITGAVPGGAGKTTLMGALLSFLPVGERIITVGSRNVLDAAAGAAAPEPVTLLAHEIGSGRWYGYVWGRDAADFFGLSGRGIRCVSCLHADTPEEAGGILCSLGVAQPDLQRISLQLYMSVSGSWGRIRRRVSGLYCALDGRLRRVFEWQPDADRFLPVVGQGEVAQSLAAEWGASPAEVERRFGDCQEALERLLEKGVRELAEVRHGVLQVRGA
ncbi:MAG: hypothetical protein ACYTFZ_03145 [Planctomycetota bacterium]|jgi:hypothetical protein